PVVSQHEVAIDAIDLFAARGVFIPRFQLQDGQFGGRGRRIATCQRKRKNDGEHRQAASEEFHRRLYHGWEERRYGPLSLWERVRVRAVSLRPIGGDYSQPPVASERKTGDNCRRFNQSRFKSIP